MSSSVRIADRPHAQLELSEPPSTTTGDDHGPRGRRAARCRRSVAGRTMADSFRAFVNGVVEKAGSASAVAAGIGMSVSAFQRSVHKNGSLGVGACLRLARFSGTSPSMVLRLARKGDVAELIENLYGPTREPISDEDREWLIIGRELSADARDASFVLLRAVHRAEQHPHRRRA